MEYQQTIAKTKYPKILPNAFNNDKMKALAYNLTVNNDFNVWESIASISDDGTKKTFHRWILLRCQKPYQI